MRKMVALVMTFVLLAVWGMPTQLYAANELAFSVGSIGSVIQGEAITVPITVSDNPGFITVGLVMTYDPNILEITSVTAPVAEMPLNTQFALSTTPGIQWIHLVNTNLVDWSGNGVVVNIAFNVKSAAITGSSSIALAFTNAPDGTPVNASGTKLVDSRVISSNVVVANGNGSGSDNTAGDGNNPSSNASRSNNRVDNGRDSNTMGVETENTDGGIDATDDGSDRYSNDADDSEGVYLSSVNDNEGVYLSPIDDGDGLNDMDDGGFIGNPYTLDDVGYEIEIPETIEPLQSVTKPKFGMVPQTGIPDMTWPVAALGVSGATLVGLSIYLLRRRYPRTNHGKA